MVCYVYLWVQGNKGISTHPYSYCSILSDVCTLESCLIKKWKKKLFSWRLTPPCFCSPNCYILLLFLLCSCCLYLLWCNDYVFVAVCWSLSFFCVLFWWFLKTNIYQVMNSLCFWEFHHFVTTRWRGGVFQSRILVASSALYVVWIL